MEVPENLLYTQEHEWIRVDKNNAITLIQETFNYPFAKIF